MNMINEANIMQRNRNVFNKILASLKKAKSSFNKSYWSKRWGIYLTEKPGCGQHIMSKINVGTSDFYLEKGGDKIFFVAKIKCEVQELTINSWKNSGDTALDIIVDWIKDVSSGYNFVAKGAEEALADNGLRNGSSESQIRASKLYKDLDSALQEIKSTSAIKTRLDERVAKQLKTRENVIPVMWYNESKDTINYPIDNVHGDNLNATSVRRDVGFSSIQMDGGIMGICKYAIQYAPVDSWLIFDLKDVPYVYQR